MMNFYNLEVNNTNAIRKTTNVESVTFLMDEKVSILIQHGGRWDSTGRYVDYKVEGVIYDARTGFEGLVDTIALQIGVDTTIFELVVMYKIGEVSPPMRIHNKMGVDVYLDQKRCNIDFFSKYPLCKTCVDKSLELLLQVGTTDLEMRCYTIDKSIVLSALEIAVNNEFDDVEIIHNNEQDFIAVNQIYANKKTIVHVLRRYALLRGFQFITARSTPRSYNLKCPSEMCLWHFKSSRLGPLGLFKVRKFCDNHTCPEKFRVVSKRQCSSGVLGAMLLEKCNDPNINYTPFGVKADMKREHGIKLSYMQAWRGRQKAFNILRGDPTISYTKLPIYLYMLENTYVGSIVDLRKTEDSRFLYTFIALDACIRGWEYCCPIVVVDGTHMRSTFEGTMLIASTLDPGGEGINRTPAHSHRRC